MSHLVAIVELHRTKSVRLASPPLAPEKENDNCQRLRDIQLPDIQLLGTFSFSDIKLFGHLAFRTFSFSDI